MSHVAFHSLLVVEFGEGQGAIAFGSNAQPWRAARPALFREAPSRSWTARRASMKEAGRVPHRRAGRLRLPGPRRFILAPAL